jgi:hypothetical protein
LDPRYFTHISITTLEKLLYNIELSTVEAPTDFLKYFWIQVAVSILTPPHGGSRSEMAVTKSFRK